jgi:hypothetical protein
MEDYSDLQGLIAAAIERLREAATDAHNVRWLTPGDGEGVDEEPFTVTRRELQDIADTASEVAHTIDRVVEALLRGMASACPNAVAVDLIDRRSWQDAHYHAARAEARIAAAKEEFQSKLATDHQRMLLHLREEQRQHAAEMAAYKAECDARARAEIEHCLGAWQTRAGKRMLRI